MTRGRFDKLCQYFHVNDQTDYDCRDPNRDELQLVRSVLDVVSRTCFNSYVAHKENSIDEAMIRFRGTLAFHQYLPAKPPKYAIKSMGSCGQQKWLRMWVLNLCRMPSWSQNRSWTRKAGCFGAYWKINWETKSYIYFDNYFNSVGLQEKLLERQLYGCGTVKSNVIGVPKMMRVKKQKQGDPPSLKLQPGESKIWQKRGVLAVMWQENKSRKPKSFIFSH